MSVAAITQGSPDGWSMRAVRDVGDVIAGKALAATAPGRMRPYLRTKNVFDGQIFVDDVLSMPMTEEQFETFRLRDGDVLLNEGQSLELVGRCAIYASEYPAPCAIQNALLRFRAKSNVSALFASYVFRHCQQTGVFARIALQTTSVAHLGVNRFAELKLPWPQTETEQRAIAAALSDVDALIAGLEKLIAKKRDLKQAAMQQLLTGQTRLPGFSGEWGTKLLPELADIRSGGTPSTTDAAAWDGGIAWCTPTDITALAGRKYLIQTERFITEYGLKQSSAEVIPAGSIVMTSRATIGECAINAVPMTTNQGFKNFVPFANVDAEFLYYLLLTQKTRFVGLCSGSTFLEIGKTQLRGFAVSLPLSKAEQTAIATVLSDMDSDLATLESRLTKTRELKQGMMQELLTGRTRLV
ncbi:MAG: type restriction modification specificity domain protein [Pseudomonadota bacterium]|jgi:type I restriction enzyme S subunit